MNWEDLSSNQSYTSIDIEELRSKLINYVQSSTSKWTNFNESDLGMTFIELAAGIGDIMGFRLDKQALETYLPTVKQRKNAKALLSLINYHMGMLVPARTTVRFSLAETGTTYPEDIVIPKYLQLSGTPADNESTIYYATEEESVLKAGQLYVDVPAVQGELITQTYTVADIMESNKLYLNTDSLADGTVEVTIADNKWTEVNDVTKEVNNTQTYSTDEDRYDRAYILFHRNFKAMLPSDTTSTVTIRFLNTIAEYGEVAAGIINKVEDPSTDLNDNSLYNLLAVTNIENSSGSAPRESVEHAQIHAPEKLTTVDRAITLDDYNNLINAYPGVARGIALDWNTPKYVSEPYLVKCYIVPNDLVPASQAQLTVLKNYLSERKMSTIHVDVEEADYVSIDVSANIYVNATEDQFESIKEDIETALINYFKPDIMDFSDGIKTSTIITLIQMSNSYVDYVVLDSPSNTQNLKLNQFPKLNSIDLTIKQSGVDDNS